MRALLVHHQITYAKKELGFPPEHFSGSIPALFCFYLLSFLYVIEIVSFILPQERRNILIHRIFSGVLVTM